jgi:hypothetical protein
VHALAGGGGVQFHFFRHMSKCGDPGHNLRESVAPIFVWYYKAAFNFSQFVTNE